MGTYLSTPIRDKVSDDFIGHVSYGASSMQGWRMSQEDAHSCKVDFDPDTETSLFAVYDGHGGAEVAQYTAKNFPDFLKKLSLYKEGDLNKALEEAFVAFDATLVEEDVVRQLSDIAGSQHDDNSDDDDEVKNEAALLREEATIPIEKLIERYKHGKKTKSDNSPSQEKSNEAHEPNDAEAVEDAGTTAVKVNLLEKLTNGSNESGASNPDVPNGGVTDLDLKENESKVAESSHNESEKVGSSSSTEIQPHCSKVEKENEDDDDDDEEGEEEDSECGEEDSEDDEWNSEENDDDDDSGEDENGFAKLFSERDDDEDGETEECNFFGVGDKPGADSGCTAVVALLRGRELYVANAGDSRCVVCRGSTAVDMSVDHKPEDPVEFDRIYKAGGKISADGRVNGGLNLSRAIGDHAYKRNPDLDLKAQMITSLPDVKHISLTEDDKFMVLACDGIWNVLSSQDVVDFVLKRIEAGESKLSNICEELFDACLAPDTSGDGTGCDNMTCVIVKLPSGPSKILNENNQTGSTCAKRKHSGDGDAPLTKRSREEIEDDVS